VNVAATEVFEVVKKGQVQADDRGYAIAAGGLWEIGPGVVVGSTSQTKKVVR
jgi:hypothetical protein